MYTVRWRFRYRDISGTGKSCQTTQQHFFRINKVRQHKMSFLRLFGLT